MSHCHDEHAGHDHGHHDHEHDHSDDITPALQHSLYQHIQFDDIVTLNEAQRDLGKAIVKKTWSERLQLEPELASDADEQMIMNVPFTGQVKLHSILLRSSPSSSAPRTLRVFSKSLSYTHEGAEALLRQPHILPTYLKTSTPTCMSPRKQEPLTPTLTVNRDDVDFDNVDTLKPTQTFELSQTSEVQDLPVKRALFNNVRRLTLFFVDNFATAAGDDADSDDESSDSEGEEGVTRLSYVGFKGEWMQLGRAPTQIIYEAAPNPNDHVLKGTNVNKMNSTSRHS
ncbi:PITH domain-containing protein [Xylaria sp. FL1042]|nr:PITH domain-containing protein [Xylaria sp. FL1042]